MNKYKEPLLVVNNKMLRNKLNESGYKYLGLNRYGKITDDEMNEFIIVIKNDDITGWVAETEKSDELNYFSNDESIYDELENEINSLKQCLVMDYLNEHENKFMDNHMISVAQRIENAIIEEMKNEISYHIGINIDTEKLKQWVKLCTYLDDLSPEMHENLSIRNKFNKLQNEIDSLTSKNESLKAEISDLKQQLLFYKEHVLK